jgi:hypothetical protein
VRVLQELLPEASQTTVAETLDTPIRGQQYDLGVVFLFVMLVLHSNISLRGSARVMLLVHVQLKIEMGIPHWTTGRLWLLRLGYYKLTRPKERADDWVWFIDHSCQMGAQKCLVVLGLRLKDQPPRGECLRLEHWEPLEILPVTSSTQADVAAQLENLVQKTGVPRAVVRDEGGDLKGGMRLFRENHPQTADIYDIKHKTACLLRHQLEADPRWGEFNRCVGTTKCQVAQTELASLAPPTQRSKARFMNVSELGRWGLATLQIVENPPAQVLERVSATKLEAKLGWLREYRADLEEWSEMMTVASQADEFVRREGLYRGASDDLAKVWEQPVRSEKAQILREQLLDHVADHEMQTRPGERLPGSTEALESSFGKLKQLEKDQSRSGFTGLLLGLGAFVSKTTAEIVQAALECCPIKSIWKWCKEKLGTTVQSQRRLIYHGSNAQENPDEASPAST